MEARAHTASVLTMLYRLAATAVGAAFVGLASYRVFDSTTAIKHLVIFCAVPFVLWGLHRLQKPGASDAAGGWRRLRPSGMHWTALVLSAGLTALMLYVWLFVGSSRADAATQMKVLLGLIIAGSAAALYMLVVCFLVHVRWDGQRIERWLGPSLRGSIRWGDIARVEYCPPAGPLVVHGKDGRCISIDAGMNGADELLKQLDRWLPDDPADAPAR